ncbi:MAG: holo-ACP synthase [Bacillota bacterium]
MMIIGIGTDILEVARIKNAIQTRPRLAERIFTRQEIDYAQKSGNFFASLAARFAAKEAASKALGTGIRDFKWQDIEVQNDALGKPQLIFHGKALDKVCETGAVFFHISLSHGKDYATAVVVLERR